MAQSNAGAPLYLASALFGLAWLFFSQTAPVWHETTSVYPEPAVPMLAAPSAENPAPTFLAGCADAGPIRLVVTNMRPQVALCAFGRQYPLQIMSYASGVPYWISDLFWPLHRGRVFWVRGAGLFLGVLTLFVARRLVTRFADATTANVAVLCMAVCPAFVWAYVSLLHYEVLPWLALAAAIYQLSSYPELSPGASGARPPRTSRVLGAAALLGLAVLANLKAIFLIAPMVLMALRARVRFSAIERRQWLLAAVVFLAVLSPSLLGNSVTAGSDLTHQVVTRSRTLVAQLSPLRIASEIPNLAVYWGDTVFFLPLISGQWVRPSIPGLLVAGVSLFYCLFAGVSFLWRGRGRLVPAACGLSMLTFILVSALLYDFSASGNYIPLAALCGIATGATVVDGTRWLVPRFRWSVTRSLMVTTGLVVAAMIWSLVGRGGPARVTTMSINAAAERELGEYITAHAEPETPLLATTYLLAGVTEAITGGTARTIKAHPYLVCGPGRGSFEPLKPEVLQEGRRCLQDRFERLLAAFPGSTRFLFPLKSTPIDNPLAGELGPSLEAVAAAQGRSFREEASFSGWGTGPLLRLVRVEAAGVQR